MKFLAFMFTVAIFVSAIFWITNHSVKKNGQQNDTSMPASVFLSQSVTSSGLRSAFALATTTSKKLRVLIVPGHEPDFGGTEYLNIMERDLNVDLALELAQYLVDDGHYTVDITRSKDAWNPDLLNYFSTHAEDISNFATTQKAEMERLISEGKIIRVSDTPHNDAPYDVAMRLYGINKWANDHKEDIVIHVHFNDSAPRRENVPGEYNGFTIYTPERQYSNSKASIEIANNIFKRLSKMFPVSNLPIEDRGVVEDQDLIAVGGNNTIDAASVLIEYGYIYEPQLRVPSVRELVLKELAFKTYLGLADFFGETDLAYGPNDSTLLPYEGRVPVRKTLSANKGVLAFQAALIDQGFYPPENTTRNDCPLSGLFGPCTKASLAAFQQEYKIKGEKGVVGLKTRKQLRSLFQSISTSAQ